MFLCRTGRLSAAALDQAFRSAGSFLVQVKANRQGDVTLALRKSHTVYRRFCVSVTGVNSTVVHPLKQQQQQQQQPNPHPVRSWDSSCGFVIQDWAHLNRTEGGNSDIIRRSLVHANRRHSSRGEQVGNVLRTGNWGGSSRRCSTGTMQTRAASTAAATKKDSDAAEQQTADNNKGEQQNLKEASTTPSSTTKAPGDPEPEGGKPNKTQQLKKVFKEYGAVGVSFHVAISLMSLGMFYVLISSGIDMTAVLCKLGFNEAVVRSKLAAGTSTFVLAYAIHKLFAPVRISITLVSVPLIVRHFRKTGLFKPPTPAP